ncbi:hypothetical protein [Psychromonas sp.]|uniref:hypothetical protein n=1 Tax=Psychromonas sp. TaxID=1884585 RepID=UPI003564BB43
MKEDFNKLVDKLKVQRDELKLKVHLGSMEAKEEFEAAEKKWHQVKTKASEIADDAVETSEEYIDKAKVVGDELKEAYSRIAKRLKK